MDLEHNQFGRESGEPLGVTLRPAIIDRHVLALDVTGLAQSLTERGQRHLRVGRANTEVADHRHSRLRAYTERPRDRCPPKQRDELEPPHSITSSARTRNASGIGRLIALAVARFTTRSNLVGCSIGRSAGFAPLRIFST